MLNSPIVSFAAVAFLSCAICNASDAGYSASNQPTDSSDSNHSDPTRTVNSTRPAPVMIEDSATNKRRFGANAFIGSAVRSDQQAVFKSIIDDVSIIGSFVQTKVLDSHNFGFPIEGPNYVQIKSGDSRTKTFFDSPSSGFVSSNDGITKEAYDSKPENMLFDRGGFSVSFNLDSKKLNGTHVILSWTDQIIGMDYAPHADSFLVYIGTPGNMTEAKQLAINETITSDHHTGNYMQGNSTQMFKSSGLNKRAIDMSSFMDKKIVMEFVVADQGDQAVDVACALDDFHWQSMDGMGYHQMHARGGIPGLDSIPGLSGAISGLTGGLPVISGLTGDSGSGADVLPLGRRSEDQQYSTQNNHQPSNNLNFGPEADHENGQQGGDQQRQQNEVQYGGSSAGQHRRQTFSDGYTRKPASSTSANHPSSANRNYQQSSYPYSYGNSGSQNYQGFDQSQGQDNSPGSDTSRQQASPYRENQADSDNQNGQLYSPYGNGGGQDGQFQNGYPNDGTSRQQSSTYSGNSTNSANQTDQQDSYPYGDFGFSEGQNDQSFTRGQGQNDHPNGDAPRQQSSSYPVNQNASANQDGQQYPYPYGTSGGQNDHGLNQGQAPSQTDFSSGGAPQSQFSPYPGNQTNSTYQSGQQYSYSYGNPRNQNNPGSDQGQGQNDYPSGRTSRQQSWSYDANQDGNSPSQTQSQSNNQFQGSNNDYREKGDGQQGGGRQLIPPFAQQFIPGGGNYLFQGGQSNGHDADGNQNGGVGSFGNNDENVRQPSGSSGTSGGSKSDEGQLYPFSGVGYNGQQSTRSGYQQDGSNQKGAGSQTIPYFSQQFIPDSVNRLRQYGGQSASGHDKDGTQYGGGLSFPYGNLDGQNGQGRGFQPNGAGSYQQQSPFSGYLPNGGNQNSPGSQGIPQFAQNVIPDVLNRLLQSGGQSVDGDTAGHQYGAGMSYGNSDSKNGQNDQGRDFQSNGAGSDQPQSPYIGFQQTNSKQNNGGSIIPSLGKVIPDGVNRLLQSVGQSVDGDTAGHQYGAGMSYSNSDGMIAQNGENGQSRGFQSGTSDQPRPPFSGYLPNGGNPDSPGSQGIPQFAQNVIPDVVNRLLQSGGQSVDVDTAGHRYGAGMSYGNSDSKNGQNDQGRDFQFNGAGSDQSQSPFSSYQLNGGHQNSPGSQGISSFAQNVIPDVVNRLLQSGGQSVDGDTAGHQYGAGMSYSNSDGMNGQHDQGQSHPSHGAGSDRQPSPHSGPPQNDGKQNSGGRQIIPSFAQQFIPDGSNSLFPGGQSVNGNDKDGHQYGGRFTFGSPGPNGYQSSQIPPFAQQFIPEGSNRLFPGGQSVSGNDKDGHQYGGGFSFGSPGPNGYQSSQIPPFAQQFIPEGSNSLFPGGQSFNGNDKDGHQYGGRFTFGSPGPNGYQSSQIPPFAQQFIPDGSNRLFPGGQSVSGNDRDGHQYGGRFSFGSPGPNGYQSSQIPPFAQQFIPDGSNSLFPGAQYDGQDADGNQHGGAGSSGHSDGNGRQPSRSTSGSGGSKSDQGHSYPSNGAGSDRQQSPYSGYQQNDGHGNGGGSQIIPSFVRQFIPDGENRLRQYGGQSVSGHDKDGAQYGAGFPYGNLDGQNGQGRGFHSNDAGSGQPQSPYIGYQQNNGKQNSGRQIIPPFAQQFSPDGVNGLQPGGQSIDGDTDGHQAGGEFFNSNPDGGNEPQPSRDHGGPAVSDSRQSNSGQGRGPNGASSGQNSFQGQKTGNNRGQQSGSDGYFSRLADSILPDSVNKLFRNLNDGGNSKGDRSAQQDEYSNPSQPHGNGAQPTSSSGPDQTNSENSPNSQNRQKSKATDGSTRPAQFDNTIEPDGPDGDITRDQNEGKNGPSNSTLSSLISDIIGGSLGGHQNGSDPSCDTTDDTTDFTTNGQSQTPDHTGGNSENQASPTTDRQGSTNSEGSDGYTRKPQKSDASVESAPKDKAGFVQVDHTDDKLKRRQFLPAGVQALFQ